MTLASAIQRHKFQVNQPLKLIRYLHLAVQAEKGGDTVNVKTAGLPNIKGFMQIRKLASYSEGDLEAMYADGTLFYAEDTGGEYLKFGWDVSDNQNAGLRQINFSASRYNSVYGSSTTVQPPALQLIPQIRY